MIVKSTTYKMPSAGSVQAVLAEIVDLGILETNFKGVSHRQRKCLLTFEVDELNDRGERMIVSRRFTASLNENASLRKFLEGWRGRLSPGEVKQFDLSGLIGENAILSVSHTTGGDGRTYANIESASKLMPKMEPIPVSGDYVPYAERQRRRQERAAEEHKFGPQSAQLRPEADGDLLF